MDGDQMDAVASGGLGSSGDDDELRGVVCCCATRASLRAFVTAHAQHTITAHVSQRKHASTPRLLEYLPVTCIMILHAYIVTTHRYRVVIEQIIL